jgi:hypothetical protein
MIYGQTLKTPNGKVSIHGHSRINVVRRVVEQAIYYDAKPRIYWWQLWRDEWPEDCTEEYLKRLKI